MTAAELARALEGRRQGSNYLARCPAHSDHRPSLSLRDADGRVLVHCHAGCSQEAVIEALRERALWDANPRANSFEDRIETAYNYVDEDGTLLYQTVRLIPKDFRQRRPDGKGGWIWNLKNVRRVLYHLPEVIEAPIVFLTEGERDTETLRQWGFIATTNVGGAKAPWLPGYTESLRGREVILIPDNDGPGWQRAERIARELLGHVARLRVFDLPEGIKDITEWFEQGHSETELIATLEGTCAV